MDTPDSPILFERHGAVAVLRLNRPQTRNALAGEDMFLAFETLFDQLNRDPSIGAAVLTGQGSAFCSGGDVAQMRDRSGMFAGGAQEVTEGYRRGIQRIPRAFQRMDVPIIAAVNGPAIGAGCDLASMCDIRIAARTARFAESFIALGIVPGDGGCWLLPRLVGQAVAAEMALTGDAIDAGRALEIGLVLRVTESDELMAQALELAQRIARHPPQAIRWTKQLLRHARGASLDEALDEAGRLQGLAHQTPEHAALVQAFFERPARRP